MYERTTVGKNPTLILLNFSTVYMWAYQVCSQDHLSGSPIYVPQRKGKESRSNAHNLKRRWPWHILDHNTDKINETRNKWDKQPTPVRAKMMMQIGLEEEKSSRAKQIKSSMSILGENTLKVETSSGRAQRKLPFRLSWTRTSVN